MPNALPDYTPPSLPFTALQLRWIMAAFTALRRTRGDETDALEECIVSFVLEVERNGDAPAALYVRLWELGGRLQRLTPPGVTP